MIDLKGLLFSYAYLFGILLLGELIRKVIHASTEFTRKFIHVGVGLWAVAAYWILNNWWAVLIPPVSFVIINLASFKWTIFKAMEVEVAANECGFRVKATDEEDGWWTATFRR